MEALEGWRAWPARALPRDRRDLSQPRRRWRRAASSTRASCGSRVAATGSSGSTRPRSRAASLRGARAPSSTATRPPRRLRGERARGGAPDREATARAFALAADTPVLAIEHGSRVVGVRRRGRRAPGRPRRRRQRRVDAAPGPRPRAALRAMGQPVFHLAPADPAPFEAARFPVFGADIARTGYYGFPVNRDGVVKIANHGVGRALHPESARARRHRRGDRRAARLPPDTFPDSPARPIVPRPHLRLRRHAATSTSGSRRTPSAPGSWSPPAAPATASSSPRSSAT